MKYKEINNFLPKEQFNIFKNILFSSDMSWFWREHMLEKDNYFFNHCFYKNDSPKSNLYDNFVVHILKELNYKSIIEARANLMLKKEKQYFSEYHVDRDFKCNTAILYMNTCNGYTLLDKNKKIKINCEENKILIFDSQIYHCAVSQTDVDRRIVINFNYF